MRWSTIVDQRVLKLGLDWDTNEMSILMFAKLAKPLIEIVGIVINSLHIKEKLFVRAIQELWQWWSRLLRVVVDTEEEEAVVMVLATAAVVVEAVTTVGILGFCKGLPNKLSLKNRNGVVEWGSRGGGNGLIRLALGSRQRSITELLQ
ncbi:hypothetical protein S83_066165, partial [Arachis hypogaea]